MTYEEMSPEDIERVGEWIVEAEARVSGPVREVEAELSKLTIAQVMQLKRTTEQLMQTAEAEWKRRQRNIARFHRAILFVLSGGEKG